MRTEISKTVSEVRVRTLGSMVQYIEEHCRSSDSLLFRGQRADYQLVPKVARLKPRSGTILAAERQMFESFKRRAHPYLEFQPINDWDWLAIAQHHGLPTRLLDWTENPLAALWFAVRCPPDESKPGAVWILESGKVLQAEENASPLDCDNVQVFRPKHIARRIISQAAFFTVHNCVGESFPPLDTSAELGQALTKLTIEAEAFCELRWQLDRFGLNAASVFPGLDGLCQHLEWWHSLLEDERQKSPLIT